MSLIMDDSFTYPWRRYFWKVFLVEGMALHGKLSLRKQLTRLYSLNPRILKNKHSWRRRNLVKLSGVRIDLLTFCDLVKPPDSESKTHVPMFR